MARAAAALAGSPGLGAGVPTASSGGGAVDPVVALLSAALPPVEPALASSGGRRSARAPYIARDPVQSLLQSTLEGKLRERGVDDDVERHRGLWAELMHLLRMLLHPVRYGPDDPDWVIDVAGAMLERLARGNHPFNPTPAEHEIADDARVVVVGDWGTGLARAQAVARVMAEEIAGALAQRREVHVVHLGDIYYSGLEEEVRRNVLASDMWPVTAVQAREGVTSWSLNGNHDMYGGGFGYFGTLLSDPRFAAQRSPDDKGTSFFRLRSSSWDLLGLDTSWDPDVLALGFVGVLEDPQAAYAARVARESTRKLMLLTHHQPVSVYDTEDIGPTLTSKLAPVLADGRVSAWLWGHEHRCMGFSEVDGVGFARCLGHGGVPVLMNHATDEPVPAPGLWEERGFVRYRGERWGRFGCVVLDLAGERIEVRYRDEQGAETRSETIG